MACASFAYSLRQRGEANESDSELAAFQSSAQTLKDQLAEAS